MYMLYKNYDLQNFVFYIIVIINNNSRNKMNIFLKTFFILFWIIIAYILINVTFFIKDSHIEANKLSFSYTSSWTYEISEDFKDLISNWDKIYEEFLSPLDSIYYDKKDNYEINENKSKKEIYLNIKEWLFFFNLTDINKKYFINFEWISISPVSNWRFFVDVRNNKDVKILSYTAVLETSFYKYSSESSKTVINKIYTFPHQIIRFSIENDKNYISDFYQTTLHFTRINDLTWNYYLKNSLSYIKEDQNIENIFWDYGKSFLIVVYNTIYKKYKENNKIENEIMSFSEIKFPYEDYIEKYKNLFINKKKKWIYFSNVIFHNLKQLINSSKKEDELTNKTISNLKKLKEIDNKKYEEIMSIINSYYITFVLSWKSENKFRIYNMYKVINNKALKNFDIFYDISSFYTLYDFNDESINTETKLNEIWNLNNNFNKFIWDYFKSLWVDINKSGSIKLENKWNEELMNYLLLYLKLYLDNSFKDYKEQEIYENNRLLISYFLIIIKILWDSDISDKDKKELHDFNFDFLSTLENYLSNTFFEKEKSENWLFILKSELDINDEELIKILDIMDQIYYIYSIDKNLMIKITSISYKNTIISIETYLKAIISYENYIKENTWADTLSWTIEWTNIKTKKYTASDIEEYLRKFNWIKWTFEISQFSDNELEFNIESFKIWDKNLSFIINPYNWNNIKNIYVDWKKYSYSFKLDKVLERSPDDFYSFFEIKFLWISNNESKN